MRLFLSLALLLSACDGGGIPTIETTTFNPSLQVDLAKSTKTADGVYLRDFTVGTGPQVKPGQLLQVHYAAALPNGNVLEVNGTNDTPYPFHLGAGDVI